MEETRYGDGCGNGSTFRHDGDDVVFTYNPMTPSESSSGHYSGGEPCSVRLTTTEKETLERITQAFFDEADPSQMRTMGSHVVSRGERRAIVPNGHALAKEMAALVGGLRERAKQ